MDRGLARRSLGPLGVLLLGLGLAAPLSPSRPLSGPAWWEIRLSVTVKGEFAIEGHDPPLSGEFTCRARWEGTIERDAGDFLLYRLRSETPEWDLVEKTSLPKGETVQKAGGSAERPLLRLNYVLREGPDLRFEYEFREVSIPLHPSSMKVDLDFPRSSDPAYEGGVRRGSSQIVVPDSDLARGAAERKFSWEWRREKQVVKDDRRIVLVQRHTAEAVVTFRAH